MHVWIWALRYANSSGKCVLKWLLLLQGSPILLWIGDTDRSQTKQIKFSSYPLPPSNNNSSVVALNEWKKLCDISIYLTKIWKFPLNIKKGILHILINSFWLHRIWHRKSSVFWNPGTLLTRCVPWVVHQIKRIPVDGKWELVFYSCSCARLQR